MKRRFAFLCDFDGTVSPHDIGAALVERYSRTGEAGKQALLEGWRSGALGTRDMIEAECASLDVSEAEALDFTRRFTIDPGFAPFARRVLDAGGAVMVLSEGYGLYIEDQLARAGLAHVPWAANRMAFEGRRVKPEFPHASPDCPRCGNCKGAHVRRYRDLGFETVMVGDGLSDRCGAGAADRVLARGELLDWCRAECLPADAFENFADVLRWARDLGVAGAGVDPDPAGARGELMRIGPVEFESPFLLAPLAGVSDSPFRQIAREQGAAGVTTEMVSADGLVRGSQATLDYCAFDPVERPIGIQIFGADPAIMAEATRILGDLPAERRPDFVDVNMGCPVRKVVNRCAGAALLTNVPLIRDIIGRMREASTLPVTAKIRLGWDGGSTNVVEVARALEDSGAQAVAIHARTRAEKFEGVAHWDMIRAAREGVSIPVIGNGDVRTFEDGARMLESTGCDAVMVGRAAFGDPWVFERIRAWHERRVALPGPSAADRLGMGLRHLELMTASVGAESAAREMRKHVAWYVRGLPGSARVREQVNRTRSVVEMAELLRSYLELLERAGIEAFGDPAGEAPPPATPEEAHAAG